MKFTIYQESRVGKRADNQDRIAYCYSRDALLMVVADGMGGHMHGELAAQIAVQHITEAFKKEARPGIEDPLSFLSRALNGAHKAIATFTVERELTEAPRTTCVACIAQKNMAYWAHAGDSRLYLYRGNKLLAQTRDHSRVQIMLEQGLIDEATAAVHPARNRVFSCLGGSQVPQIDLSPKVPLRPRDVIALCTDGLWGPLGNNAIGEVLADKNPMLSVPRLMNQAEALAGESGDNLSLAAMQWDESYAEDTPSNVQTKTMPLHAFTTQMGVTGKDKAAPDLSEADIEKTIDEIRSAIRKFAD